MQNLNQTNGHEPEFQMEGKIVYFTGLNCPSGTEKVNHSRQFLAARKGQQWKIRKTNLHEDAVVNGIEYDEMGCDGTTIYELKSFDGNNPEISNVKNIITAQGRVRNGNALVGFNAMHLPSIFLVNIFFPDQSTGKPDVSYAIDAKVQAIQPLRDFSYLPEPTKQTRITETRYRLCAPGSGHPIYAGSTWMTEEEVEAKNRSLGIAYEKQNAQDEQIERPPGAEPETQDGANPPPASGQARPPEHRRDDPGPSGGRP